MLRSNQLSYIAIDLCGRSDTPIRFEAANSGHSRFSCQAREPYSYRVNLAVVYLKGASERSV